MTELDIQDLLRRYKAGDMTEEEAVHQIRSISFEDMGLQKSIIIANCVRGFPR